MKNSKLLIFSFLSIFISNLAFADADKCSSIFNTAKIATVNGVSNIPKSSFVIANENKVYFYTAPDQSCRQNASFVVLGDYLYAYKMYDKFVYVNYITIKGKEVKGWVDSSKIKNYSPGLKNKEKLNITDFIVSNGVDWFGLGSQFQGNSALSKENELSSEYVGDFPNEVGGLNKFYSHSYSGFSVTTSNVGYSDRLWSIDDGYIISAISVTVDKYHTTRNIKVGDTYENILKAYDGIAGSISKDKIGYKLGSMLLEFNLVKNKVTSISLSSGTE